MRRALIISYYWPPTGGSGVQRWVKFAKYLPQFGWQPVIYTPKNPEQISTDHSLVGDIPDCAIVLKRHITEPYSLYAKLTGKKSGATPVEVISSAGKGSRRDRFALWVRSNLFVPDPRVLWIRPSAKYLKRYLRENPVDVIISTGPPHSMHLIAKKLSKKMNIPWVADFRDPWTDVFYFKHLNMSGRIRRKHKRLEMEVMEKANRILVVSGQMERDFQKRLSQEDQHKIRVIPNGYDEDDFPCETVEKESFFTLTHTGLFAKEGNPDKLWMALGELASKDSAFKEKLRIRIIGKVDPQVLSSLDKEGLSDNYINMGYLDHFEAIEWQRRASLLLLPLRKEPEAKGIVTGKFFEYLASGTEIMAFGPPDGNLAELLKETSSGMIFDFEDERAIGETVRKYWQNYLDGKLLSNSNSSHATKYSRKALTGQLVNVLNEL